MNREKGIYNLQKQNSTKVKKHILEGMHLYTPSFLAVK